MDSVFSVLFLFTLLILLAIDDANDDVSAGRKPRHYCVFVMISRGRNLYASRRKTQHFRHDTQSAWRNNMNQDRKKNKRKRRRKLGEEQVIYFPLYGITRTCSVACVHVFVWYSRGKPDTRQPERNIAFTQYTQNTWGRNNNKNERKKRRRLEEREQSNSFPLCPNEKFD